VVRQVDDAQFRDFVLGQAPSLRLLALGVTGDRHLAEDLVAGTFERAYQFWARVSTADDPGAYLRTMLLRLHTSERRRGWFRHENPTDTTAAPVETAALLRGADHVVPERLDLLTALAGLTERQRTVVILRYVEDRPVQEVAEIMGTGVGTVKRQSHDALRHLRATLTPWGTAAQTSPPATTSHPAREVGHA
jgi:RNA polymerase sigma-70 factor (sigma-E family)